jgi:hypothetical protein
MGLINLEGIKGVGEIFTGIGSLAKDIRTAITGVDPAKQAEIELKLVEMENAAMLSQVEINKIEAASQSKFVSWWRPCCGWVCVAALALTYLLLPLVSWALQLAGQTITLFKVDMSELYPLLIALLGLGGLRSWEKVKGVQASH